MPLYIVKAGEKERLIEARNKSAARNFAARDLITIDKASNADCFRLAKAGVEVEVANEEEAAESAAE